MTNLTIEMPDDLAHRLAGIAATQHKSLQELAVERLSSLVEGPQYAAGSAASILRAMKEPPYLSASDIDDLDAAIAAGGAAYSEALTEIIGEFLASNPGLRRELITYAKRARRGEVL